MTYLNRNEYNGKYFWHLSHSMGMLQGWAAKSTFSRAFRISFCRNFCFSAFFRWPVFFLGILYIRVTKIQLNLKSYGILLKKKTVWCVKLLYKRTMTRLWHVTLTSNWSTLCHSDRHIWWRWQQIVANLQGRVEINLTVAS